MQVSEAVVMCEEERALVYWEPMSWKVCVRLYLLCDFFVLWVCVRSNIFLVCMYGAVCLPGFPWQDGIRLSRLSFLISALWTHRPHWPVIHPPLPSDPTLFDTTPPPSITPSRSSQSAGMKELCAANIIQSLSTAYPSRWPSWRLSQLTSQTAS